jgi:phage terminase small subunit
MKGRPNKAKEIKKMQGTYRNNQDRGGSDVISKLDSVPTNREILTDGAAVHFKNLCYVLQQERRLNLLDIPLYEEWAIFKDLQDQAYKILKRKGFVHKSDASGMERVSGAHTAFIQYSKHLLTVSNLLGLSPMARERLSKQVVDENPFDQLISESN